jgi:hypothetical protein
LLFLLDVYFQGLDVTQMASMASIGGEQVGIWQPYLALPEATSFEITDHYLRLFAFPGESHFVGSKVLFFQHYIVTLGQPNLNYAKYPDDAQTISFRLFSFAQSGRVLSLGPMADVPDITLFLDATGVPALTQNPLWTYIGSSVTFGAKRFNQYFGKRATCNISIMIQRQSTGIVTRLALPMLLLVVLGAATFWADLAG